MNLDKLIDGIISRFKRKVVHDTDFKAFALFERQVELILDVGANLGQSIASFRLVYPRAKIVSFEANPMLAEGLSRVAAALPGDNSVFHFGLGDEAGDFILNVPYVSNQAFLEEASISIDYYELPWVKQKFIDRGGLTRLEQVSCSLEKGDCRGFAPDIIKVDVEGAEARVLKGLRQTIETFQPIVFVENSDWHNVTSFMHELGYAPFRYEHENHRLVPFHGATTNAFYLSCRDAPRG